MNAEDPTTRDHVVTTSTQVLDLGFDGIHFDFEPVRSGSTGYLTILEQVRAVTSARRALLSVSAPVIDPLPGLHSLGLALFGHGKWWSQAYFAQVARRVDQIAIMSYDTAMPTRPHGHHASAETVAAAIRGVRLGLGRTDRDRRAFGVALYVDFTATEQDWADYRSGWS